MDAPLRLGPVAGTLKWWKRDKGYGVVLTSDTAPKGIWVSFMHIEARGSGSTTLARQWRSGT